MAFHIKPRENNAESIVCYSCYSPINSLRKSKKQRRPRHRRRPRKAARKYIRAPKKQPIMEVPLQFQEVRSRPQITQMKRTLAGPKTTNLKPVGSEAATALKI